MTLLLSVSHESVCVKVQSFPCFQYFPESDVTSHNVMPQQLFLYCYSHTLCHSVSQGHSVHSVGTTRS